MKARTRSVAVALAFSALGGLRRQFSFQIDFASREPGARFACEAGEVVP